VVDVATERYWINDTSPRGYILERVLRGSSGDALRKQTVSGQEIRYVDWLIPGVLAMNMMFSALFGVGYVIVRYRKNGMLKRLKATPLTAFEFLAAQIASRLWLIMTATIAVFLGTDYFIDFSMFGSYLDLFIVFTIGAVSLISLGMIVASRTASEEFAGGLLNLISWPMMFLSGVWFSLEGLHPVLQKLALLLPLTHLITGARAIMIDGAGLSQIAGHLLILVIMSGIFMIIGAYSFRWE
jgi:ABC-type multidrug transport system permease subunit